MTLTKGTPFSLIKRALFLFSHSITHAQLCVYSYSLSCKPVYQYLHKAHHFFVVCSVKEVKQIKRGTIPSVIQYLVVVLSFFWQQVFIRAPQQHIVSSDNLSGYS